MTNGGRPNSPQEAFERLLTYFDGWVVCDRLNTGLRRNTVQLIRDGIQLTPAEIADEDIYIRGEPQRDGRWCCTVVVGRPRPMMLLSYEIDDTTPIQAMDNALPHISTKLVIVKYG